MNTTPQSNAAPQSAPPQAKHRVWKGPRELPANLAHEEHEPIYVLWRYGSTPNGRGKYPKLPYSPNKVYTPERPRGTYRGAKTDEPLTWGTFAQCQAAADDWPGWFDGIGRVLQTGEVGIDYDGCYDASGALAAFVAADLAEASGYKERSVSGAGLHIIVLGQIADAIKTDTIELYPGGSGRYFVLSGDELAGSARPAASQQLLERLVTTYGNARKSADGPAAPRLAETVAYTPELAAETAEASANLAELRASLRENMTTQLAALLLHNQFPPAMHDTSVSGARAVVVAQLHRAPKRRYTDAEIYVLARDIWHRKAYEGAMAGRERALSADCWRLIAAYRPGAAPKVTAQKRDYRCAPAPLEYLAAMADASISGAVLLNRDERAALRGVSRASAQRLEAQLVILGYAELTSYSRTGPGARGRSGMLHITPAGRRALNPGIELVNFAHISPNSEIELVNFSALESREPRLASTNTYVCVGGVLASTQKKRVLPTPEPAPALLSLAALVAEAMDAFGTAYRFGQTKPLARVQAHVAMNSGGRSWPAEAVEAAYRIELARRERARDVARIEAMGVRELARAQKRASTMIANALALKPQRQAEELAERYQARVERWRKARRAMGYWRWYHGAAADVLERKQAELTARMCRAPEPLQMRLDALDTVSA